MTSEQVAKVLSSLGKRKVCFQHGDKVEIVKGINVTNDNVILISELPSGIKYKDMTEEEAKRLDEDAGLGCAIWGLILIFSIIGSSILTYIINS